MNEEFPVTENKVVCSAFASQLQTEAIVSYCRHLNLYYEQLIFLLQYSVLSIKNWFDIFIFQLRGSTFLDF